MAGFTQTARNMTFKLSTAKNSEVETLSNVPYLYDIEQEFKTYLEKGNKEELENKYGAGICDLVIKKTSKYNVSLAYNPTTSNKLGDNKPFFVVPYHAHSDFPKKRAQELKNINTLIVALNKYLSTTYSLDVKDYAILGDFNENVLIEQPADNSSEKNKVLLNKPVLQNILENASHLGAQIISVSLPKGIMNKQRGIPGRPYSLYSNPQPRKNLLLSPDGKNLIVVASLDAKALQNQATGIEAFLKKLEETAVKQEFELKDLLTDSPYYRDHLGSNATYFNQVVLAIDSYLPTNGAKEIKDPKDYFKKDVQTFSPEELNEFRALQEASTEVLFSALAEAFKVQLNPNELNTYEGIISTLDKLRVAQESHCPAENEDLIKSTLIGILDKWQGSKQYKTALALLKDEKHNEVNKDMGAVSEKVIKAFKIAKEKKEDFDLVAKVIQLCGQAQHQEMTGGYGSINKEAFPGPKKVDDAHVASTLKMITDKDHCFLICNTESGKNKSDYFHNQLAKEIAGLRIPQWTAELSDYLKNRAAKYQIKDKLSPADRDLRSFSIKLLIKNLNELAQIKILPADSAASFKKDADTAKWIKACDDLVKNIHTMKKLFPGKDLTACLNKISFQIQAHRNTYVDRDDKDSSLPKQFISSTHQDEQAVKIKGALENSGKQNKALIPFINQINQCYKKIEQFDAYKNADSMEFNAQVKHNLVLDMKTSLNKFAMSHLTKMPTTDELDHFKWDFMAIAHSQDSVINSKRSNWTGTADILLAVLTLGILHAVKALAQKINTGTCRFGLFSADTTRMSKIKGIEHQVSEIPSCA